MKLLVKYPYLYMEYLYKCKQGQVVIIVLMYLYSRSLYFTSNFDYEVIPPIS